MSSILQSQTFESHDMYALFAQSHFSGQRSPVVQTPQTSETVSALEASAQDFPSLIRRRPLPSLLASRSRYLRSREGLVGEPLADDASSGVQESSAVLNLTSVEPEGLLVQITEEMEGLNTHIGTLDRPLEQTPEVFQAVGVDLTPDITLSVVDHLVLIGVPEISVGLERVGENFGTFHNLLPDFGAESLPADVRHDLCPDFTMPVLAVALQKPHNCGFARAAGAGDFLLAPSLVHVASTTTDEGFIYFDLTGHRLETTFLHSQPDSVIHKPCGLLSDAERTGHLIGRDPVLAVDHHPQGGQPLVQAERRVLEDRPDLDGELFFASLALPQAPSAEEGMLTGATTGAGYPVGPAQVSDESKADIRIREEPDSLSQSLGKAGLGVGHGVHEEECSKGGTGESSTSLKVSEIACKRTRKKSEEVG
jgi:hypothetical protein